MEKRSAQLPTVQEQLSPKRYKSLRHDTRAVATALAQGPNFAKVGGMFKFAVLLILAAALLGSVGCGTPPGSREYIPGTGWVPN